MGKSTINWSIYNLQSTIGNLQSLDLNEEFGKVRTAPLAALRSRRYDAYEHITDGRNGKPGNKQLGLRFVVVL